MMTTATSARSRIWATIARCRRISRTEIGRQTGLSKSRVSLLTRELLDRKLIRECVATGRYGRPAVPLEINPDLALFFGITLHCDPLQAVIMDFSGRVRAECAIGRPSTPEACLDAAAWAFARLTAQPGIEATAILSCGVSLPAHISADGETCLRSTVLDWQGCRFREHLQARIGIPVTIENDLNCLLMFMATEVGGSVGGSCSLVALGEGLGSAHMIDGRLVRGSSGGAGEIAHARLVPMLSPDASRACRCGNRGCAETVASIPAILSRAGEARLPTDLAALCRIAAEGDAQARAILDDAARAMGAAIAMAVQVLDPERVIAVLPAALCDGSFANALRGAVNQSVMPAFVRDDLLSTQVADGRDWAVGAARVASRILMREALSKLE